MQLIFHGLPLAAKDAIPVHPRFAEFLQRDEIRHFTTFFLIVLACGQVVGILSLWGASKAIVHRDSSTLLNALKVWVFGWLVGIGVGVGLLVGVPAVAKFGDPWRVGLVLGGTLFCGLMLSFLVPMKIYVIGFLRALIVLLLAGCINSTVMGVIGTVVLKSLKLENDIAELQTAMGKTPEEQRAFGERLVGKEAPDEIDRLLDDALHPIGPRPPLPEREAMVRTLQQKLSARKRTLKPGDSTAQAVYQEQLNRYLTLLNEVNAERKAQPKAPPR